VAEFAATDETEVVPMRGRLSHFSAPNMGTRAKKTGENAQKRFKSYTIHHQGCCSAAMRSL
jgi:hypothetical protein